MDPNRIRNCGFCDTEFESYAKKLFCTETCRNRKAASKSAGRLSLRFRVMRRDNFRCVYCGRNPREEVCTLQVDHIFPQSKGGANDLENYVTACNHCNQGKGDKLLLGDSASTILAYVKSIRVPLDPI